MLTPEAVRAAGYRPYPDHLMGEFCTEAWTKEIRDPEGVLLYLVELYRWQFPKVAARWTAKAQLRRGDERFNVELLGDDQMTVDSVEVFYLDTYWRLDCTPQPE